MKTKNILALTCALSLAISLSAVTAQAASISGGSSGLASPAQTITFDEILLTPNSSVTNEYSSLGVTFSPNLYYSPQTGFPNITGNTLGNFDWNNNSATQIDQFSLNFLATQSSVAFNMVSNATMWTFEALLGNSVVESFSAGVGNGYSQPNYDANFFGFTGISFDQIRLTGNDYVLIDNLQMSNLISPVPEPETYTMMLIGLGLLGFQLRRKSKKTTPLMLGMA